MKYSRMMSGILIALLLLSSTPVTGQGTQAAGLTLTVTKFTDGADGVCDADCSLREAIAVANNTPGADSITLLPGTYQLSIPGFYSDNGDTIEEGVIEVGDLNIFDDLTLRGAGMTRTIIDGGRMGRVILVAPGTTVTINDLTIRNGLHSGVGGGISNWGNLTLARVKVTENALFSHGGFTLGGGIVNLGVLTMQDGEISHNTASAAEGSYGNGGGFFNFNGEATLTNVLINENSATSSVSFNGYGGGIYNAAGTVMHINNSRIQSNIAQNLGAVAAFGGGIYNAGALDLNSVTVTSNATIGDHCHGGGIHNEGQLVINQSTISDNSASREGAYGDGGGLYSNGGGSNVTLNSSIVSGNTSSNGGSGGGLWNSGGSTMTLINSTVSGNVSTGNGGGINNTHEAGLLTILNSTVANNSASELGGGGLWNDENSILVYQNAIIAGNGDDCANEAVLTSQGHNLVGSETGCDSSAPGDLTVDPDLVFTTLLGPLLNNGGATPTHALLPGSPAIDAGDDGLCAAELVNGVDQRGVPRLQGAQCDIGAYEYLPPVPANTLRIQALIDGRSQLIVHGNTAQWHHFDFAAPGRHEFVNRPTVINGTSWFPAWPDQPDAENRDCNCISNVFTATEPLLPSNGPGIGLNLIRSRSRVQIVQFPDAGNDNTLIVEFDDNAELGADTYIIDLSWGQPQTLLFVSSHSSGKAGNVQFRDEDIVAYDLTGNTWQMVFDGSDVGVTKDVDAFAFRPDGTLLLSFNASTDVPGLGQVDDADIVHFTPTALGSTTAGNFALYLRGADVGLTTDGEDIDAIGFTADGNLVVSTIGDFAVTNLIGKDEDLIRLDYKTASVWSFLLDGSTVGLANEDVNGLWIDPVTGELYLTVKDSFAFGEGQATVPIDADDIFVCTPMGSGAITSCAYRLFWDSDGHDYGSENLNAIGLGVLPPSFVAAVQASSDASPTPEELAPDDDIDDLNLEESIHQLYLPLIEQ